MPIVDSDSPAAKYSVSVWLEKATYFSTYEEAEAEFQRQDASREFGCGELYEWDDEGDAEELKSFNNFAE